MDTVYSNGVPHLVITCSRSDGKSTVIDPKSKKPEENAPTKEQLSKTKVESGQYAFYQEIKFNDKRHMEWRKKLALGLMKQFEEKFRKEGRDLTMFSKWPLLNRMINACSHVGSEQIRPE